MSPELIRPILTVDIVLFTLVEGKISFGLQTRPKPPFKGRAALIGGYVRPAEDPTTTAAAQRVLKEKTELTPRRLEQLMTFSGVDRDPRGWSASVAYYALLPAEDVKAGVSVEFMPIAEAVGLPFDHDEIVAQAAERCRRRASYSSLPAFLLPPAFTLPELRGAYEALLGRSLNDSAFRRKIDDLRILESIPGEESRATARPAQLYRLMSERVVEFDRTI